MAYNTTRMTDTEKNELIERLTDEVIYLSEQSKDLSDQLIAAWHTVKRQQKALQKADERITELTKRCYALVECVNEQDFIIEKATDFIQATAQPESLITED